MAWSVPCDSVPGSRFLLLADTHDTLVDWPAARARITELAGPVDGIVHCGDLTSASALDDLAALAPVWAVRNRDDPPASPPRLVDGPRVLEVGALRVGVVVSLSEPPVAAGVDPVLSFTGLPAADIGPKLFGDRIDVCVFGGSHVATIAHAAGCLFVNPGSPTLAQQRAFAVLAVDGTTATLMPVALPAT